MSWTCVRCGSILVLVQFLFYIVFLLFQITIKPVRQRKVNFESNSNLNHNMYSVITGLRLAEYLASHMYDIVARKGLIILPFGKQNNGIRMARVLVCRRKIFTRPVFQCLDSIREQWAWVITELDGRKKQNIFTLLKPKEVWDHVKIIVDLNQLSNGHFILRGMSGEFFLRVSVINSFVSEILWFPFWNPLVPLSAHNFFLICINFTGMFWSLLISLLDDEMSRPQFSPFGRSCAKGIKKRRSSPKKYQN